MTDRTPLDSAPHSSRGRPGDPWGKPFDSWQEGRDHGYREGRRDMAVLIGVCAGFVALATAGLWLV